MGMPLKTTTLDEFHTALEIACLGATLPIVQVFEGVDVDAK